MGLLAPLVIVGSTALAGVSELKQYVQEWNARGFKPVEPHWRTLSIIATVFAALFGILSYLKTGNTVISVIVATVALFSIVIAFTDSTVRKVPIQVSNYMVSIGAVVMFALILSPDKEQTSQALQASSFFPRVPTDSLLNIVLLGLALVGIGLLGFMKVPSMMIAQIFLSLGQLGIFLAVYSPVLWVAYSSELPTYWKEVAHTTLIPLTALSIVWFFSWAVGNKIGGADILYMYFLSMTAVFILGPGGVLWAIVVSMPIQLVAHAIGKKLGWGELKDIRNGPIAQFFENRKAKKENRPALKTKKRRAIAFLPALTITVFVIMILALPSSV